MDQNHRLQQRGFLSLVYVAVSVISLILFPVSVKAAPPNMITPNDTMTINKTSPNNQANSNGLILNKNPIYQASGWALSVTKLKNAGFPQQVEIIFENGTINGVGKVTNLETWILSPVDANGFGQGVITTKDKQMVTWTAHDISGSNKNGIAAYRGHIIFNNASSTGKLAFLNNLQGSYITEANDNNQTTKIWKFK